MRNKGFLYDEFGRRLAIARKNKRLSQGDLGALVGLSRTSITNIERGRQAVQLHQLYQLAWALKTDLDQLLPKQTSPSENPAVITPEAQYLQDARSVLLKKTRTRE